MASSTIFWVFGMTRLRIEPRSPGPLANTLLINDFHFHSCHNTKRKSGLIIGFDLWALFSCDISAVLSCTMRRYTSHSTVFMACYWNLCSIDPTGFCISCFICLFCQVFRMQFTGIFTFLSINSEKISSITYFA